MNNNWRRQKGEIHHQGIQGARSYSRKPSLATWQPTVPSWEKKFCNLVGSVPWRRLLETKRFMHLYDNIINWNDLAVEEAFHNAKNRFWAEINGLPCDIRLPDPDSYIDKIDWDSEIDPELLLDLEREPKVPDEKDKSENVVILGNSLLLNQSFACGGWGDAEWGAVKESNTSSNWKKKDYNNYWEHNNGNTKDSGYENCWNNSWELNQRENSYNGWDNNEASNVDYKRSGDWGTWDVTRGKREDAVKESNTSSNWKKKDYNNYWEHNNGNTKDSGYGNCWNNSWELNQRENNYNGWDNNEASYVDYKRSGDWGTWDVTRGKREDTNQYTSRYKTTRFHGDNRQNNRGWRNPRGRQRTNFAYDQPTVNPAQ
ncbi:hypothetical protein HRI_002163300 [Hibiscus trionum]|uniref:Uncharacterized protein n=1 Tax=Hibiscus trionum TaxID=183268 RepID=A0A9W7HZT1_HIBTR|nr:hypothetical protein HRI_002163300 [Hibiscus trionum]